LFWRKRNSFSNDPSDSPLRRGIIICQYLDAGKSQLNGDSWRGACSFTKYIIYPTSRCILYFFVRKTKYKYIIMYFKYKYKIHFQNVFQIQNTRCILSTYFKYLYLKYYPALVAEIWFDEKSLPIITDSCSHWIRLCSSDEWSRYARWCMVTLELADKQSISCCHWQTDTDHVDLVQQSNIINIICTARQWRRHTRCVHTPCQENT